MIVNRRSLLKAAVGAGAATVLPLGSVVPAWAAKAPAQTMAGFQAYVNTPFRFTYGASSVTMPLSAVSDDRTAFKQPAGVAGECFSLVFTGPQGAFPQATCAVDHAAFGKFNLLIVPGATSSTGQAYRAVYNRLAD